MFDLLTCMQILYIILFGSVFFLSISIWVQSAKGKKTQRTMFHKRALQNTRLVSILFLIAFLCSMLDIFLNGPFKSILQAEFLLFWYWVPVFSFIGFIASRFWLYKLTQNNARKFPWILALINLWASLKALCTTLIVVLAEFYHIAALPYYEYLKPTFSIEIINQIYIFYNKAFQAFFGLFQSLPWLTIIAWILLTLFIGLTFSYGFSALYCLFQRKKEDYGRDYYQFVLADYTKSGFIFSMFICIFFLILIILNPNVFLNISSYLNSSNTLFVNISMANTLLWVLSACILLPSLFYGIVYKSTIALRYKALIVLAPLFLCIGIMALLPLLQGSYFLPIMPPS